MKTADWYFKSNTKTLDAFSNIPFFMCSILAFYKKKYLISLSLFCITIGSTIFHLKPNENTLFVDRLSMTFAMAIFYNMFFPQISSTIYFIVGVTTLFTQNLDLYIIFRGAGIMLFLANKYYRENYWYALIIYLIGSASQIPNYKYVHVVKHFIMALGIALFIW